MASDRKKYVMAAELAIEREMAYRKQLELSCPKQNIEYGENPFSRTVRQVYVCVIMFLVPVVAVSLFLVVGNV